ncbi:hypothetical protein [Paenibacillus apii]|uniref:hypothetical protein n=1 Tax=Paenibacillus apii TaxID=1850370 RepID=UPI00143A95EB|nr:hypothetical protein [Paenibacillus apii]NJJ41561.1 hypothetical protein [Paenibacillus apii]
MKKRIFGLVVFVLLLGSSIGFAAGTSLVGAKVSGVYSIKQDGKKIADAAIINGSAYVPVRTMSEATGATLTIEGKTIILEKKDNASEWKEERITKLKEQIVSLQNQLKVLDEAISKEESNLHLLETPELQIGGKQYIEELKKRRANTEASIVKIEAQLAGLQK